MTPWIQTHSGQVVNLADLTSDVICIEDIAHSLSHICRYTGHSRVHYSVAEHCYWASEVALRSQPKFALYALLHDAHEAYVGDVSAPLKSLLPDYRKLEDRIQTQVLSRFGLNLPVPPEVKAMDHTMMCTERQQLLSWPPPQPWVDPDNPGYLFLDLKCWAPEVARDRFLTQFEKLQTLTEL